ncbi:MAG: hypothetical protein ACK5JR_20670 [Tropicimonas sp.]|uniref:hypothetical protein n=1 Tax=Tropicimonas sp. TaxID=2067044 RepID=UPI003A8AD6F0
MTGDRDNGDGTARPARWRPARGTYARDVALVALVVAAVTRMALYWSGERALGAEVLVGPVLVALVGWALARRELSLVWEMTETDLLSSRGCRLSLAEINRVRALGSFVQVRARTGGTILLRYLVDAGQVRRRIEAASTLTGGDR